MVKFRIWYSAVSTIAEIEVAIERLSVSDRMQLRDWLLARTGTRPKTGAELAALRHTRFHLSPPDADGLARDLEFTRQAPPQAPAWD
jgi:hypothetical protein